MEAATVMQAPANKSSILTRVIALALIAGSLLVLAYVRFAPATHAVSVPAGARDGQLFLSPCTYPTEVGSSPADCGTLVVPENRDNAHSRLIALPVVRIRARSGRPLEPIFRLEGGPGSTNMSFPQASRLIDRHDVVLVGYRGIDGSSVLDCPEVTSTLQSSADLLAPRSLRASAAAFAACATRLRKAGVDLAGYTFPEQADDLDAARAALGYSRIDLLSQSAGTRLAMIYAWRHPESTDRSVMIGVNPPGNFVWNADATDQQLVHYSSLCSADAACSQRTADLATTLRQLAANTPDHWSVLPIEAGNARLSTFLGLANSTSAAAPLSGPVLLDSWLAAAHGDPSGLWLSSLLATLVLPQSFVWGEFASVGVIDSHAVQRYYASAGNRGSIIGNPGTDVLWAGGGLVGAWPSNPSADQYQQVTTSRVPTLLIGGTVDFATPAQNATSELLPELPNGHQVVLSELGHTTDFWHYEPDAGSHLLNTFFDSGEVDASRYTHRTMDFSAVPSLTSLARVIVGAMLALAALAVLSLLWMAYRVRRRGRLGRVTGGVARTVFPLVLGLGGWSLASLLALTLWPGLSPIGAPVVVLSIGAAVALGLFGAWVHRDWPTATRTAGLVAVVAGAMLGAWFGFGAVSGVLVPVATIVGAAAAGNLALIILDSVSQ
jgi:pimeloyl-ACP methyl ester carboxylesterase